MVSLLIESPIKIPAANRARPMIRGFRIRFDRRRLGRGRNSTRGVSSCRRCAELSSNSNSIGAGADLYIAGIGAGATLFRLLPAGIVTYMIRLPGTLEGSPIGVSFLCGSNILVDGSLTGFGESPEELLPALTGDAFLKKRSKGC